VNIDGVEYNLDELTQEAREQLTNIQFVDAQIQQLNNEWAVADTARIGYTRALNTELAKLKKD
jgi:cell division protein ZapA (FtsZ GTPase activity inhibitor)